VTNRLAFFPSGECTLSCVFSAGLLLSQTTPRSKPPVPLWAFRLFENSHSRLREVNGPIPPRQQRLSRRYHPFPLSRLVQFLSFYTFFPPPHLLGCGNPFPGRFSLLLQFFLPSALSQKSLPTLLQFYPSVTPVTLAFSGMKILAVSASGFFCPVESRSPPFHLFVCTFTPPPLESVPFFFFPPFFTLSSPFASPATDEVFCPSLLDLVVFRATHLRGHLCGQ